jgi:predicted acyl esterase
MQMLREAIRQREKQMSLLGFWKSTPFRNSRSDPVDSRFWAEGSVSTYLELTGHPVVHLWISSTAGDANFFAYLEEIAPDGKVSIITDGRLRGSLRALGTPPYSVYGLPWHRSFEEDVLPFVPGRPAEVVFDCLPMSHVPPPMLGIHRDAVHSSYIALPVIHSENDLSGNRLTQPD